MLQSAARAERASEAISPFVNTQVPLSFLEFFDFWREFLTMSGQQPWASKWQTQQPGL